MNANQCALNRIECALSVQCERALSIHSDDGLNTNLELRFCSTLFDVRVFNPYAPSNRQPLIAKARPTILAFRLVNSFFGSSIPTSLFILYNRAWDTHIKKLYARARVSLVSWEGEVMHCCLWFRSVLRVRGPWPKRYGYQLSINF